MKKLTLVMGVVILLSGLFMLGTRSTVLAQDPGLTPIEELGKALFFDENLSANGNQSCATCHGPAVGFTGPDSQVNAGTVIYQGSVHGLFGNRKPPAASYAGDSPLLHLDASGEWVGGMFWDGRATGNSLGDPLAEQAQGPFLNPLEQAIPDAQTLCNLVVGSNYAGLFEEVWGAGTLTCATPADVTEVYKKIGRSVAAYERSIEVNPFSSKFDQFWDRATAAGKDVTQIKCGTGGRGGGGGGCSSSGTDPNRWSMYRNFGLTDNELIGLAVFNTRAGCSSCHSLQPGSDGYPLFTDFGYANLGVPKNPANPFYNMPEGWNPDGENWIDYGLGGFLQSAGYDYETELGKQKVPTLRNVDLRSSKNFIKAYTHNGYFKSLTDVVTFYHWRGMMGGGCGGMGGGGMGGGGCGGMGDMFPPPEVNQNLATLNMFPGMQINYIVTFLKTLSDGYFQR